MKIYMDAAYYVDLTYSVKDYEKEVKFIDKIIKKHNKNAKFVYDVACGSGSHSVLLKNKGYDVEGVDLYDGMLKLARKKGLKAHKQDMRSLKMKNKADAIITMFNAINHLNGYSDLKKMLKSYINNLNDEGVIIFDCNHTIDNWGKEYMGMRKYFIDNYYITKSDISYMTSKETAKIQQIYNIFVRKTTKRKVFELEYDNFIFDVYKIKKLVKDLGLKLDIYIDFSLRKKKHNNRPWYVFVVYR